MDDKSVATDLFSPSGSAVLSPCGRYRYRLDREVQASGLVFAYFGINPSTADASIDDHTVRKWRGFTQRFGGSRFIVGNVFSFRATDVSELARCNTPIGPDHEQHLVDIIREADVLVPCWGATTKVPRELKGVFDALLVRLCASTKPIKHFGFTNAGDPRHPLMLGYGTPLHDWPGL